MTTWQREMTMSNVLTLHFSIIINAPVRQVWQTMLDAEHYRQWTSAFCEGSYFSGSWQQGETMRFLSPSGDGMVAIIAEHQPYQLLSIKHIGFVDQGVDDVKSEKVKAWAPAFENYIFREVPDGTQLLIEQEVAEEYVQYMSDTWPKALDKLKLICESA
jgi:uncharacterized protein YndB with AHSA1/START domain